MKNTQIISNKMPLNKELEILIELLYFRVEKTFETYF
jgi:hypothetical protein